MTDAPWTCCDLDDETLIHRLKALVGRDRKLSAHLLMHLAEVDVRGLFRDRGYSSLFGYCVTYRPRPACLSGKHLRPRRRRRAQAHRTPRRGRNRRA